MRIISLAPFITRILTNAGVESEIVAVREGDSAVGPIPHRLVPGTSGLETGNVLLGDIAVSASQLRTLQPTHIFLSLPESEAAARDTSLREREEHKVRALADAAAQVIGSAVTLRSYAPVTLPQVFDCLDEIPRLVGKSQGGSALGHRLKAQFMDWGRNFYERMKNKRVTVLVGVDPPTVGGLWIPEMVRFTSGVPQENIPGRPHLLTTWDDIRSFQPNVLIVAPGGMDIEASKRSFKVLEKVPGWESLPAVKRGDVFFTDERYLLHPSPELIEGMAILVSAVAGLESGYITKRDSFFRLRMLELQRHKL